MTELTDGVVRLRPLEPDQLPHYLERAPDEEMRRWLPIPELIRRAGPSCDTLFRLSEEGWRAGTMATFSVEDASAGDLLGTISVRFYRQSNAEVTYSVLPHARRRGVATALSACSPAGPSTSRASSASSSGRIPTTWLRRALPGAPGSGARASNGARASCVASATTVCSSRCYRSISLEARV